jgi:hypothetical protein
MKGKFRSRDPRSVCHLRVHSFTCPSVRRADYKNEAVNSINVELKNHEYYIR